MAAGALLAAKGAGKDVKIIGTDGLPAGGIEAVAKGDWAATFPYPTGAKEAPDLPSASMASRRRCSTLSASTRAGTACAAAGPNQPSRLVAYSWEKGLPVSSSASRLVTVTSSGSAAIRTPSFRRLPCM